MVVCVPVTREGLVDARWAEAGRMAVAEVEGDRVASWREYDVAWDRPEQGDDGQGLDRVADFLRAHHVETVAAYQLGDAVIRLLFHLRIHVHPGATGDARQAAVTAARLAAQGGTAGILQWERDAE